MDMSLRNRGKRKPDIFQAACIAVTVVVFFMTGGNILMIICRGMTQITQVLTSQETLFAIGLSVKSALISSAVCLLLAIPTAYAVTKMKFLFCRVVEVILELTMSLPYIVIGLSLLLVFSSAPGKYLKELGIQVVFHPNGIILAQLIVNLPFAIKLIVTAFDGVDEKMEKIAGLLGGTPFQVFATIIIPLCKNSIISAFILIWSRALGEFGATLMLVGVTRMKTETLSGSIFLNVSVNNIEGALASSFILLFLSGLSLSISGWLCRSNRKMCRYAE